MKIIRSSIAILFFLHASLLSIQAANFDVEDYGRLPFIRSVSISPDGKHLAYIQRSDKGDYFVIADAKTMEVTGGANASKIKARSVYFATNEHVILVVSKTAHVFRYRSRWEHSTAIVYNLKTKKMTTLLKGTEDLYPAQSGLGKIIGLNMQKKTAYMPAFIGKTNPRNHLMRVDLNYRRGKVHAKGSEHTIDWFVDSEGTVLAKEEYHEKSQEHRVYAKHGKKWTKVYSKVTSVPSVSFGAVSSDGKHLMFMQGYGDNDAIYKLSLENGAIDGPFFAEENFDIEAILTKGLSREFRGIRYSGLLPSYMYQDKQMEQNYAEVQSVYPGSSVRQISATADASKIIYRVSGNEAADKYVILDIAASKLLAFATGYPAVDKKSIGEIKVVRYKARDGLWVQAVVTWPVNIKDRSNLPMLVLPHGGPESYDSIQFDWWAQYFARSGYVVFQPNFRGSSGSGTKFKLAGRGEWGRAMQDDISDGVAAMIEAGHVDASRICIMGASYGGYAALAGGAFTPDLYQCVVSVAGVSDLPKMLSDERYRRGRHHWVVSYWNEVIGDSSTEREKLKAISPVNFANDFRAPVLLLHGKDDTVVPISQSKRMLRALKKARQPVELITLKGEDHWLSDSDTRLHLLTSISKFLQVHNPPNVQ